MRIAIVGNSPTHAGVAMAADASLAGHEVRLARWTEAEIDFAAIRSAGGIEVTGDPRQLVGGRLGKSQPALFEDPAKAVAGAELVVLDLPPADLEARLEGLAPHLEDGQVVHINTCSYWSAFRAGPVLRKAGKDGVTLTESIAPTLTADYEGARLVTKRLRTKLPLAAFPAERTALAAKRLQAVYPSLRPADNVLQTSFANLNQITHAGIALVNIGWFDRSKEAGETINFWMDGSTPHAALMAEAQDAERRRVSEAYSLPWTSAADHLNNTYGGSAAGFRDAVRQCDFYRALPKRSPEMWRRWMTADVAMAHVPFAEVAKLAGVGTPVHDAYIAAFSVLLASDFRLDGLTLEKMGLKGASARDLLAYARSGKT
jgi:opine dehydrogenase